MEAFLGSDPLTRTRSGALPPVERPSPVRYRRGGRPVSDDPRPPVPADDLPDRPVRRALLWLGPGSGPGRDGPPVAQGRPGAPARPGAAGSAGPGGGRGGGHHPVPRLRCWACLARRDRAVIQPRSGGQQSSPSGDLPDGEEGRADRRLSLGWPAATSPPGACPSRPSTHRRAFPSSRGNNGGATVPGVTATVITVVYYIPPPGDLASAIEGAAGTPATNLATAENYVAMFNRIIPLYGRRVVLVPYDATGDQHRRGGGPGRRHQGGPADPRLRLHRRPGSDPGVPRRAGPPPRAVPRLRARVPPTPGVPTGRPLPVGNTADRRHRVDRGAHAT